MHELLETLYVTHELTEGICKPEVGWDFAILVDSYTLYYQTIDILESEKRIRMVVKDVFTDDIIFHVLRFDNSKLNRYDTDVNCSVVMIKYESIEDMIQHISIIQQKLNNYRDFHLKRMKEEYLI